MVGEVSVHDDYEVPRCEFQTVNVGSSKAELSGARCEDYVCGGVEFLKLSGDFLGSVGGGVVYYYYFPV